MEAEATTPRRTTAWEIAVARWTTHGFFERWLAAFVPAFFGGIGRRFTAEGQIEAIDLTIHHAVQGRTDWPVSWSKTRAHEIQRLLTVAEAQADPTPDHLTRDRDTWCAQNHLCTPELEPTSLGRALCKFRGRDAVEFVLALGVELSVGGMDPYRASAGLLAELLAGKRIEYDEGPGPWETPYSRDCLSKLTALGVVDWETEEDPAYCDLYVYSLHPEARDLVSRVVNEPDSRFRALVRALLDAERGRVVADVTGQPASDGADLSYARSVAHEIRNFALPLSTALNSLWAELGSDQPDLARRQELRARIDRSMDRLNSFASEAVKLAAAIEPERIELASLVTEAIAATEVERNGRISVHVAGIDEVRFEGAPARWRLALINLIRNACQARAGTGSVWISTVRDDAAGLHLYVDDDGPGVRPELREQIFEFGHSTRGGLGLGLADARRTVSVMGGSLTCEPSPRGGARFHFTIPPRHVR